uniref:CD-6 metallohionein-2 n=1 Tax=Siphoviridae sp. ctTPJ4 TaxID=2825519 RepID=A0A8S5V0Q3_9CAUD|nr:MAG TPA: CD-6 metallohionein-2 [Siphoviridae sp. ctTPJ4]
MTGGSCTCGSSLLVAGVGLPARLLEAGLRISSPQGPGSVHVQ